MFFSKLFKNKIGDKTAVSNNIFNTAVVLNIVCVSTSLLLLLGCFFVETEKIRGLVIWAIIVFIGCYLAELLLALLSVHLNKDKKTK